MSWARHCALSQALAPVGRVLSHRPCELRTLQRRDLVESRQSDECFGAAVMRLLWAAPGSRDPGAAASWAGSKVLKLEGSSRLSLKHQMTPRRESALNKADWASFCTSNANKGITR
jgi:hypothetical protein